MRNKQRSIVLALFVFLIVQVACSVSNLTVSNEARMAETNTAQAMILSLQATQQASIAQQQNLVTMVAETVQAELLQNVQPVQETPLPAAVITTETIQAATNTPEYTATPEKPMVSVSEDTNCRTGPGTAYPSVGALLVGETAEVVGKFRSGDFWIIDNPDSLDICWLWGEYATVMGDTSGLKLYAAPPTPIPSKTPTKTSTP